MPADDLTEVIPRARLRDAQNSRRMRLSSFD